MPFSENAAIFFDGPVKDFRKPADWDGPEVSYRLRFECGAASRNVVQCLQALVQHPEAPELRALVIGKWCEFGECSSASVVDAIVKHQHRLRGLRALFLGDITTKETKCTWIRNSDMSSLLHAYPNLEVLRIRGGQGLRFADAQTHDSLRALIVETNGMPRSVIEDLCRWHLPNLVHLELWLGAKSAGWDGSLVDLQPLLDGSLFPSLKYLGLRNSEIADEIAWAVINAPLLHRLDTLDLSNGNLSDFGGRGLWGIMWDLPLRQLILNHHYMSPKVVQTLQTELLCKVSAEDAKCPNGDARPIFVYE